MNSMAMKVTPFSSPMSKMVTMFGWMSRPAACASRRKRSLVSRASASEIPCGMTIVLIATWRSIFGSCARNTWPMAPLPISRMISKRPRVLGVMDSDRSVRIDARAEGEERQVLLAAGARVAEPDVLLLPVVRVVERQRHLVEPLRHLLALRHRLRRIAAEDHRQPGMRVHADGPRLLALAHEGLGRDAQRLQRRGEL